MKSKIIFYSLVGGFALLQFFPIDKTLPPTREEQEFHVLANPPNEVMGLLKHACYDCHSNHTRYPWYTNVQPVGWWIANHIEEGREELNFSAFGKWNEAERAEVLDHCADMVKKGAMPTRDYQRMHPEAKLSAAQRQLLVNWFRQPGAQVTAIKASYASGRDTCDDSDANPRCCFRDMPDNVTSDMTIAGKGEPGERLVVSGQIFKADGKTPYANVLMYAYHTDVKGIYPKKGNETGVRRWHGRLHGWCRTDAEGRYSIRTIRPAHYPGNRVVAHIHHVVWAPDGSEPDYIHDTVFSDDPLVDERYRAGEKRSFGSSGITTLHRDTEGVWVGKRDIVLRKGN